MLWLAQPYRTPIFKTYMSVILPNSTFEVYISMILLDYTKPFFSSIYNYNLAWSHRMLTFKTFMNMILPNYIRLYFWSIHKYYLAWLDETLSLKNTWVYSCLTVRNSSFEAFMDMILHDFTGPLPSISMILFDCTRPYFWSIYEYALTWLYKTLLLKHSWL